MYNKSMDCRYSKNQEHDKKICKVFWGGGSIRGEFVLRTFGQKNGHWFVLISNILMTQWEVNLIGDRSPGRF